MNNQPFQFYISKLLKSCLKFDDRGVKIGTAALLAEGLPLPSQSVASAVAVTVVAAMMVFKGNNNNNNNNNN